MGFITKQWLEGESLRYRHYEPVKVKMSGESTPSINESPFGRRNGFANVAFRIRATRIPQGYQESGDYQELFFAKDEIDDLLPAMIEVGEQSARLKIALSILADLTDEELSQFMTRLRELKQSVEPRR